MKHTFNIIMAGFALTGVYAVAIFYDCLTVLWFFNFQHCITSELHTRIKAHWQERREAKARTEQNNQPTGR